MRWWWERRPQVQGVGNAGRMVMQPGGRGKFTGMAQRITMAQAVDMLSQAPLGRPVVDETGLKGRYDITIDVGRTW